jgi:hypothetical protein
MAQLRGLATRKELPNGMTEWWLASDEGAVAAHLGVGKKSADRRKLRPGNPFIARGEREREDGCGPVRQ